MSTDGISILQQNNRDDQPVTRQLGMKGERLAVELIEKNGCRIVVTNFKAPIGRNSKGVQVTGEIDIIALDGETLCFIEVKTRTNGGFGGPLSAVDVAKQRQITRTAKIYRKIFGLGKIKIRYDAVTVLIEGKKLPHIEHHRSFWTEDKFRKQRWGSDEMFF